ncbi:MAG TPA: BLUF domain-containing protein [Sphingomicrobium sp.]|jgi:hypothetical protein
MIQQLVYISTMRSPMIDAQCDEILRVSRRNNARDGITGLLVVGRTRFLQLLEGPPVLVTAAYSRIRRDPRHFAAVVIDGREAEQRACADWTMGCLRGGDAPEHGSLADIVAKLAAPIEDANLRAQFVGFADIQSGARAA